MGSRFIASIKRAIQSKSCVNVVQVSESQLDSFLFPDHFDICPIGSNLNRNMRSRQYQISLRQIGNNSTKALCRWDKNLSHHIESNSIKAVRQCCLIENCLHWDTLQPMRPELTASNKKQFNGSCAPTISKLTLPNRRRFELRSSQPMRSNLSHQIESNSIEIVHRKSHN